MSGGGGGNVGEDAPVTNGTGMRRIQRPSSVSTVTVEEPVILPQRRKRQGGGGTTGQVLVMMGFIFLIGLIWWGLINAVVAGEHAKHKRVRPTSDAKDIIESTEGLSWDIVYERHRHQIGWVLETEGDLYNVGFPDGTSKWYPSHAVAKVDTQLPKNNKSDLSHQKRHRGADLSENSNDDDEHKPRRRSRRDPHSRESVNNDNEMEQEEDSDQSEIKPTKHYKKPKIPLHKSVKNIHKNEDSNSEGSDEIIKPVHKSHSTDAVKHIKKHMKKPTHHNVEKEEEEEENLHKNEDSNSESSDEIIKPVHKSHSTDAVKHIKKHTKKTTHHKESDVEKEEDDEVQHVDVKKHKQHSKISNLDLSTNRPHHRESCQYPALHDYKWKEKFGWGIKKEFPSCRTDESPFATISYPYESSKDIPETFSFDNGIEVSFNSNDRQVTIGEYGVISNTVLVRTQQKGNVKYHLRVNDEVSGDGDGVSIIESDFEKLQNLKKMLKKCGIPHTIPKFATIDMTGCQASKVFGIQELSDSYFKKLHSTVDAERRQNQLKAAYASPSRLEKSEEYHEIHGSFTHIVEPYIIAYCSSSKYEIFINLDSAAWVGEKKSTKPKLNIAHVMFDSTSLAALIRACPKIIKKLEDIDSKPDSPSRVFSFKHLHAVSCCSPGNQIPMYSGRMNGEGSPFVLAEPNQKSDNWLWNIAKHHNYNTYFSLDNCPDKSARDFQAWPSVDHRVVAPMCLAGILLSHKERTCLGQEPIDNYVFDSLKQFWDLYPDSPKYAAAQLITPHEETEKLLIELDDPMTSYLSHLEETGALNNTAVVFFSDHGINFGRYAATHDGEIDKMFPFVHVILPKWLDGAFDFSSLRSNEDALITPYDVHQLLRELVAYPDPAPPYHIDDSDPPLPKPEHSHIVASMKKLQKFENIGHSVVSPDRGCSEANIPPEFCTCLAWVGVPDWKAKFQKQIDGVIETHTQIISDLPQCNSISLTSVESVDIQVWPTEYHPKEQPKSKKIWMAPNRDMLRIQYKASGGLFEAMLSLLKNDYNSFEVSLLTRIDAMKSKCGVTEKKAELLCICKEEENTE